MMESAKAADISAAVKRIAENCVNLQNISLMKIAEKDEKTGEEIREQGYYILRTCHDMNEYIEAVSGRYCLAQDKTDLCGYLYNFCKEAEIYTGRKGMAIILKLPEERMVAETDREKLCFSLANIILNAMENSSAGTRIKVTLSKTQKFAKITVSDRGSGMSKETLEHCIEPLFCENEKAKLGLGLTLAHHFAAESGGRLRINSEEGKGTTVAISIPLLCTAEEISVGYSEKTDFADMPRIIKTVFSAQEEQ